MKMYRKQEKEFPIIFLDDFRYFIMQARWFDIVLILKSNNPFIPF